MGPQESFRPCGQGQIDTCGKDNGIPDAYIAGQPYILYVEEAFDGGAYDAPRLARAQGHRGWIGVRGHGAERDIITGDR